jgi:signal transduction histidine kinase
MDILIVDDLEDNRTLLKLDLIDEIKGVKVLEAPGGMEALRLLEKRDFSVVVCDLMMPEIDGFTLFKRFKEKFPNRMTPFIFLSANRQRQVAEEGLRLGAYDYLTKPYELPELISKVTNLARMKHLTDSLFVTQKELIRSNDLLKQYIRDKDEFLAVASHDMKAPLMSLLGMVDLLRDEQLTGDERGEMYNSMERSAQEMLKLARGLQDLAKVDSGAFKIESRPTDIGQMINDVIPAYIVLARQKGIEVETELLTADHFYNIDPGKLQQCVSNLFYNSVKFTNSGGKIRILVTDRDGLLIQVSDNGIGIPKEMQPDLFVKYSKARREGTGHETGSGLGLAIVKRFAELMNGTVTLDSDVGSGTVVTLHFPGLKPCGNPG